MSWIARMLGKTAAPAQAARREHSPETSEARRWLEIACERDFTWSPLGEIRFPSRRMFVGDPTNGSDGHMENMSPIESDALEVWVLESGPGEDEFEAHRNTLVRLEASGATTIGRGTTIDFGVDAACFAVGDAETGDSFSRLTDTELDAGRGDNFEWILPHIQERPHFARWIEIPPEQSRMLLVSTGNDGGFAAVWLHGTDSRLSGVLIDIMGRESDGLFVDKLLPEVRAV